MEDYAREFAPTGVVSEGRAGAGWFPGWLTRRLRGETVASRYRSHGECDRANGCASRREAAVRGGRQRTASARQGAGPAGGSVSAGSEVLVVTRIRLIVPLIGALGVVPV